MQPVYQGHREKKDFKNLVTCLFNKDQLNVFELSGRVSQQQQFGLTVKASLSLPPVRGPLKTTGSVLSPADITGVNIVRTGRGTIKNIHPCWFDQALCRATNVQSARAWSMTGAWAKTTGR